LEKYICISITILFPANIAIVIAMHFASIVNNPGIRSRHFTWARLACIVMSLIANAACMIGLNAASADVY